MFRQKTINVPIYECKLTMILSKDLSHIEKKYKTGTLNDFGACTIKDKVDYRHYIVCFTDKDHLSNIAHEVVHIKNYIYLDCAMEPDLKNDEPEAYLTGWLFQEIYKFLN